VTENRRVQKRVFVVGKVKINELGGDLLEGKVYIKKNSGKRDEGQCFVDGVLRTGERQRWEAVDTLPVGAGAAV